MSSKVEKKKRVLYSREVMEKAIQEVKSGMSINKASEVYNIPRSSLHSKVNNLYKKISLDPLQLLVKLMKKKLFNGCSGWAPRVDQ